MPTNILADRLRRLSDCGLISKTPYQTNPVRYEYELTDKGDGLRPALEALAGWASSHLSLDEESTSEC